LWRKKNLLASNKIDELDEEKNSIENWKKKGVFCHQKLVL